MVTTAVPAVTLTTSFQDLVVVYAGRSIAIGAALAVAVSAGHTVTLQFVARDSGGTDRVLTMTRVDTAATGQTFAYTSATNPLFSADTDGLWQTIVLQAKTSAANVGDTVGGEIYLPVTETVK
jgi:hypothetical protein